MESVSKAVPGAVPWPVQVELVMTWVRLEWMAVMGASDPVAAAVVRDLLASLGAVAMVAGVAEPVAGHMAVRLACLERVASGPEAVRRKLVLLAVAVAAVVRLAVQLLCLEAGLK